MLRENIFNKISIAILISILSITLLSCSDDDPVSPQENHFEAIGMVFYQSGIEVARIVRGEATGALEASEGEMSGHTDIKFLDEDENIIDPPSEDADKSLSWEIANPAIAGIWQHEGEEGAFEFHLEGLHEGETTIEFFVMHGDHHDYRSGNIPVVISGHNEGTHGAPVGINLVDEESGETILTVDDANGTVSGTLDISVNSTTDHIEVDFFDANGVIFHPSTPTHSLVVEVANSTIAGITGQEKAEPWAFKVEGKISGTTIITIKLMHDDSVGKEFSPITVNVN